MGTRKPLTLNLYSPLFLLFLLFLSKNITLLYPVDCRCKSHLYARAKTDRNIGTALFFLKFQIGTTWEQHGNINKNRRLAVIIREVSPLQIAALTHPLALPSQRDHAVADANLV